VGWTSVSAVGRSSIFAFLSLRVAVVGFFAFAAGGLTGFF